MSLISLASDLRKISPVTSGMILSDLRIMNEVSFDFISLSLSVNYYTNSQVEPSLSRIICITK